MRELKNQGLQNAWEVACLFETGDFTVERLKQLGGALRESIETIDDALWKINYTLNRMKPELDKAVRTSILYEREKASEKEESEKEASLTK